MTPLPARRPSPSRQRGAATLIVVMILFFVVSLVAAYASRNMIFEQKTSANQYRSTQAFEAAEAGLEWALTMLNGGRLEADCSPASPALATPPAPATPPTKASFRQRYLNVDAATGMYTETMANRSIPANLGLNPTCVYNGAGWTCTCPISTAATPSATPATGYTGPQPAFRVRLLADTGRAGVLRVESVGCTR